MYTNVSEAQRALYKIVGYWSVLLKSKRIRKGNNIPVNQYYYNELKLGSVNIIRNDEGCL